MTKNDSCSFIRKCIFRFRNLCDRWWIDFNVIFAHTFRHFNGVLKLTIFGQSTCIMFYFNHLFFSCSSSNMNCRCTILAFFVFVSPLYANLLQEKYCETRQGLQCCVGRDDECGAPISGTKCYCDDFCNRTGNGDCCPDYSTYCKGLIPGPIVKNDCVLNELVYNIGDTLRINCNLCECKNMGSQVKFDCKNETCLIDEDILVRVNENYGILGWRASNYTAYWGKTYNEGRSSRLGTIHSKEKILRMTPISQVLVSGTIPRTFDARLKWPNIISKPKDQGWCGASWVFSTVSVVSDRFAIMTNGKDQTFLSPQQLLSCSRNQRGCKGGQLTRAWTFIRKYGLVSESCYPWTSSISECKIRRLKNQLTAQCPTYISDITSGKLHRVGPVYRIAGELGIMHEILYSGPVQATMRIPREFFSYRSGIFKCLNVSVYNDYHSVRIIGWGEEIQNNKLVKYWIVANSWGVWWGEHGFFRIHRGTNECLIEEFVIAAWANVEDKSLINVIPQSRYHLASNKI